MAEIIAKFNTVDKTLVVTKDGQMVDNIDSIYFGKRDEEKMGCAIHQMTEDEDEGTREMHSLYSSEDKTAEVISKAKEYLAKLNQKA